VQPESILGGEDAGSVSQGKMFSLFEAQKKIYPRSVSGVFSRWRLGLVLLTQWVFYGLPWLQWGQRQAVLFDLDARRFYVFGLVLYPQDFIYLSGLLVISALSLFLFTAVAGRLWCGFTCPQTVYTEIFLWVEHWIEGDRSARLRRDAVPMSVDKFVRKSGKHLIWVLLSLWTGFTFVGYFTPVPELGAELMVFQLSAWEIFWVLFYALATYGNAGFLREQVCRYMCPYARFQSAMFDHDTLIVTYDEQRGDPRGARSRKADLAQLRLGSCVDCSLCVQVCPTGIDIRRGLQYECIGCGACADVCDAVMDKMGYSRGLVRFSTENAVLNQWNRLQIVRRIFRPRVLIYAAILCGITGALAVSLSLRVPFRVDVVRDRSSVVRELDGGLLENVYRLQLMNATERAQQFKIGVRGLPDIRLASIEPVSVGAAESRWTAVRVQVPAAALKEVSYPIQFEIEALSGVGHVAEKSVFLLPH
jgi:cytochrome c oxidase accessory protein FixG